MSFEITIDQDVARKAKELAKYPDKLNEAIFKGFRKEFDETERHIQIKRLRGKGPFPVSQHKLGVVTGRLRQSLDVQGPRIKGGEVSASIGTAVKYAAAHEFGFRGLVTIKGHRVDSHLRKVAGRSRRSRVNAHTRKPHKKRMNIPARAPIQYGIKDRLPAYERAITQSIIKAWEELQ